ncbi:uncharacterized protein DUF4234 [Mobilisporobacter senegalensis]|uniref:Uncharacterized protein DUF4234 n=1 Tax=Mobilisporobacter senegalensis TaxID=1329262 RepID=A0A3N1XQ20_9FIRM|nr:DUF4234 domain-containing protein [Mobilisporobacter senegalensis]ROR27192.1 uncharacterized protein DUF4234 [Mobilisporobacter senegalensis]
MKQRDIAISVILSIITCGIYGIYWMIVLTDDIAKASDDYSVSGGMAFLLSLITCGIYSIYWAYKMGQNITIAKQKRGMDTNGQDMSIIYLLLQVFGLGIVNYCLMQSELNKMDL